MQGNVVALLDSDGCVVVKYIYDAWGNHAVQVLDDSCAVIANLNPFRYRSYYFDTETELYFLKTRYYDPELGRFMTIDDIDYLDPETINGLNLYAYCGNNPVMNVDPSGTLFFTALIIGLIVGAVVGATVGGVVAGVTAYNNGARGWELFGWTLLGVFGGAVIGGIVGGLIGAGIGAIGSAMPSILSFLNSSFTFALPGLVGGGSAVAAATITVTGAQIVAAGVAVLLALNLVFMGNPMTRNQFDTSKPHRSTKKGKSNWDKHSGRRSGGPEKKDVRMKYRKWKRGLKVFPFLALPELIYEMFDF